MGNHWSTTWIYILNLGGNVIGIVGMASHDHHLASHVVAIETKLLEMSDQVFQVLEACNANAKVMDKLNATIEILCNNY